MTKIVICSSPSHVVKVHGCLVQKGYSTKSFAIFQIIGVHRTALITAIRHTVSTLFPNALVIETPELPRDIDFNQPALITRLRDSFLSRLPTPLPTEIWSYCLYADAQKFVIESLPNAALLFYDDGIESYNQQIVRQTPLSRDRDLDAQFSESFRPKGVMIRHLKRVKTAFLSLTSHLGIPAYLSEVPNQEMDLAVQRKSLEALGPHPMWLSPAERKSKSQDSLWAVIVGSSLYRLNILTQESEEALYRDAVIHLLGLGYKVILKPHPRNDNSRSILPLITSSRDSLLIPTEMEMPLEWIILHRPVHLIASLSSTSLLTLSDIHSAQPKVLCRSDPIFSTPPPEHVKRLHCNLPMLMIPSTEHVIAQEAG